MLREKLTDTESPIEWQDVTDFRQEYFKAPEARDTTRKGAKLLYEYLDAGWDLTRSTDNTEIIDKNY